MSSHQLVIRARFGINPSRSMTNSSVERSRIRDGVRDSKIRLDISSKLNRWSDLLLPGSIQASREQRHHRKLDVRHVERDFARLTVDEVSRRIHHLSYNEIDSNRRVDSKFDEGEGWFLGCNGIEDPFHGLYNGYNESDSLIDRFKRNLPVFDGFWHPEDLMSWIDAIEDFFEEINPPEPVKCKIVWYKMKGAAYYWWKILQNDRLSEGKNLVISWPRMRELLICRFAPGRCSMTCPSDIHNCTLHGNDVCKMGDYLYPTKEINRAGSSNTDDECSEEKNECNTGAEVIKHTGLAGAEVVEHILANESTPAKCSTKFPLKSINSRQYQRDANFDDLEDKADKGIQASGIVEEIREKGANKPPMLLVNVVNRDVDEEGKPVSTEIDMEILDQLKEDITKDQTVRYEHELTKTFEALNVGSQAGSVSCVPGNMPKLDCRLKGKRCQRQIKFGPHDVEILVDELLMFYFDPGGVYCRENMFVWVTRKSETELEIEGYSLAPGFDDSVNKQLDEREPRRHAPYKEGKGSLNMYAFPVSKSEQKVATQGTHSPCLTSKLCGNFINGSWADPVFFVSKMNVVNLLIIFDPGGNWRSQSNKDDQQRKLQFLTPYTESSQVVPETKSQNLKSNNFKWSPTAGQCLKNLRSGLTQRKLLAIDTLNSWLKGFPYKNRTKETHPLSLLCLSKVLVMTMMLSFVPRMFLCVLETWGIIHLIVCADSFVLSVTICEKKFEGLLELGGFNIILVVEFGSNGLGCRLHYHIVYSIVIAGLTYEDMKFGHENEGSFVHRRVGSVSVLSYEMGKFLNELHTSEPDVDKYFLLMEGLCLLVRAQEAKQLVSNLKYHRCIMELAKNGVSIMNAPAKRGEVNDDKRLLVELKRRIRYGGVILWEVWNDVNNTNIEGELIITKLSTGTFFPCWSIRCENGQLKKTLKLFHMLVNGLDPPMDVDGDDSAYEQYILGTLSKSFNVAYLTPYLAPDDAATPSEQIEDDFVIFGGGWR